MGFQALVTDEPPDRLVFRPLAALLVRTIAPTPVTPNQLTVAAAGAGVAAGVALGFRHGVLAAALLGLMLVLDCADGQLARLRGGGDLWGRIADGIGDYVTATAVHLGLLVWLVHDHGVLPGVTMAVAAALSMAWCAYLMDKLKRRYRGDLDDLDAVLREREGTGGLKRLLLSLFLPYARGVNRGPEIGERAAYRRCVHPAMTLWLWVGPTTHYVVAALCVAFGRPLLYVQIAVVPMNVLTLAAILLQRHLERAYPGALT